VKTTVPHCSNIVPRLRLFSLLDSCRSAIPLTWIAGPAGSGKTSLVASYLRSVGIPATWYQVDSGDRDIASFFYHLSQTVPAPSSGRHRPMPLLTPEYQQDIPAFARRFFELLFSRMTADSVLVLDDYHLTPADSALHHVLSETLSTLPKGSGIFIIGREMPLPQFGRLSTGQQLKILGWNDLRLTFEETEQIVRAHRPEAASQGWSAELHQAADGWAAGLIALIQGITARGTSPLVRNGDVSQEIFDYFAAELFEKLDERLQGLLLKTAFLPKVGAAAASELTGLHDAGELLSMMSRAGSFTSEYLHPERVYQYHPLFRAFLTARAGKTMPAGQLREIKRTCATLLETAGRIEDAADLFIELDAWGRVVAAHSRSRT
jgi:LuxR family transcriptional regulator, maltose regulon positive regulatory protein